VARRRADPGEVIGTEAARLEIMRESMASLGRMIPALPVRDVRAAAGWMAERFGFAAPHVTDDFAVVQRDDAVLHPTARSLEDTDFGTREFHTVDRDGNLLTFFAVRPDGS
jgi:hypothetical protein